MKWWAHRNDFLIAYTAVIVTIVLVVAVVYR